VRDPRRLGDLVDAALRVFGRVGFARAQVADIAREAGVSTGTVYNYVEGKEALMLLCATRAFDRDPTELSLPVPAPGWDETLQTLEAALERFVVLPTLEQALARATPPADAAGELRAIVEELYDLVATTRQGATALERSAVDLPELAEAYFGRARRRVLDQLAAYLEDRIAGGVLAPVPDVPTAARFIAESVTWFARHRHGDPDGVDIPEPDARTTTVALVVRAFSAPSPG
jgi:AcrR family transcriptional regulator